MIFRCSVFDVGRWILDIGYWILDIGLYWPLLAAENHRTHLSLTRNLSMRFPGELRIKMNSSPMNKENIQHRTSNIEHSTDYGAVP
jgi:hypothetical protein